ncbi:MULTISPECIES: outer membrane beta-barrel protein [unclassified Saccharicrinis]|uniref:outer membrane beta-barrel protein n=1 Tax=unclassified Saccharicrinis TaxID=2646859 RepID=UPI003D3399D7
MKKLLLAVVMMTMVSSLSFAQNENIKYGGGLSLGTDWAVDGGMGIGINIRGEYEFNEDWSVSPGFTFVFPSSEGDFKLTAWQLNADAHYNFYEEGDFEFYGLAGLNYSHVKVKYDGPTGGFGFSAEASDGEIGIDLGAGTNYDMFFGEIKYDTAFEHLAITVGVRF